MASGWRYRATSVLGTAVLSAAAVGVANHPVVQRFVTTSVPLLSRLNATTLSNGALLVAALTVVAVVVGALFPLYKPRPRRILDAVMLAQKRVVVAMLALATVGYFDYTYRLPRATLLLTGGLLFVALPLWFVWTRRRPSANGAAVIVGDDPAAIADIYRATGGDVVGYVSPQLEGGGPVADGGLAPVSERAGEFLDGAVPRLGGLMQLDDVLVEHDVGTAYLAFASSDRGALFAALSECHEHGVATKVHREHADSVLLDDVGAGPIVDVDLEPLDLQDYLLKRAFDVAFAGVGLLVLAPVALAIAVAVKLDSPGPVLYAQERTATFGDRFTVYKFRTMTDGVEDTTPVDDAHNDRITRFGQILRRTHLDETPQLWTVLTGKMSTVGPRAAWTDEELRLEAVANEWRKRWFVKPGLTGLAQVHGVSSTDPEAKLRFDVEYIRQQSFWFDLKIVVRQLWMVGADVVNLLNGDEVE